MTWVGWLALAGALLAVSLPQAATVRAGVLAGRGRLGAHADNGHADSGNSDNVHGNNGPADSRARGWQARLPVSGLIGAGGAAAVTAVAVSAGPLVALAAAASLAVGVVLGRDVLRRRRETARAGDLMAAVRVLVDELEAGSQPVAALTAAATVGPAVAPAFVAAAAAARRGGDAAAVLTADGAPELVAVGAAWRLGATTGSALAGVLGRVAADLAAREDQRCTVAIALAGPRSSAVALSGLPAIGIALGAAMGARPLPFLLGDPSGRVLCCVGVLCDVAGLLWIRRIVRRAERP